MKKTTKTKRGFTLIELLVVIAIIGLLSVVAMVALNGTRAKAKDTQVKANMNSVRTAMELIFDENGVYGPATINVCTAAPYNVGGTATAVTPIIEALQTTAGTTNVLCTIGGNGVRYAVRVKLPSNPTTDWWCVDSSGYVGLADPGAAGGTGIQDGRCAPL